MVFSLEWKNDIFCIILCIKKRKENKIINIFIIINFIVFAIINYIYGLDIFFININYSLQNDFLLFLFSFIYLILFLLTFVLSVVIILSKKINLKLYLSSLLILFTTYFATFMYSLTCDYEYFNEEGVVSFLDIFIPFISKYWYIPAIGVVLFIDYFIFVGGYYKLKKKIK